MKNRPSTRTPRQSELRALSWLRKSEKSSLNIKDPDSKDKLNALTAFTVRRTLLSTTEGGLYQRPDLIDFINSDHGAKFYQSISMSILRPSEGKNIAKYSSLENNELRQKLQTAADSLPTSRSGVSFKAIIFGAKPNQTGPRFVGILLNRRTQAEIKRDRWQFLNESGHLELIRNLYTAHITLFETYNQQLAVDLKGGLNDILGEAKLPIELGPAEVIPISNSSPNALK